MLTKTDEREGRTREWCSGLPLVHRRSLSEAERERIRREAGVLRRRGCRDVILFLASFSVVLVIAPQTDRGAQPAQNVLTVGFVLWILVGLPVTLLLARDSFTRGRQLRRDLRHGTVKRFAGASPLVDDTFRRLWRAHLAPDQQGDEWTLEVLPASGRVWRAMDLPVPFWMVVQTVEVAEPPPFAEIASQWLSPIEQEGEATLMIGQRELSREEREEMCRYSRRLWQGLLPLATCLTLWLSVPVTLMIGNGSIHIHPLNRLRLVFLAICTAAVDYELVSALRLAHRMRRDESDGRVVIVRIVKDSSRACLHDAGAGDAAKQQDGEEKRDVAEVLPMSRRLWTENGRPSAWRLTPP